MIYVKHPAIWRETYMVIIPQVSSMGKVVHHKTSHLHKTPQRATQISMQLQRTPQKHWFLWDLVKSLYLDLTRFRVSFSPSKPGWWHPWCGSHPGHVGFAQWWSHEGTFHENSKILPIRTRTRFETAWLCFKCGSQSNEIHALIFCCCNVL